MSPAFVLQTTGQRSLRLSGLNYCNITVTTIHPGYHNIPIKTVVLLPLPGWNERMMGMGGSGFTAGNIPGRTQSPLTLGFASVSTSAGVSANTMANASTEAASSDTWALRSTGNVDTEMLSIFGYRALGDAAAIGKAVVTSFYKQPPKFKYWNGCSTGGRQAHMLAQRYPDAYDGLLAGAPAINWARFLSSDIVPELVFIKERYIPPPCEMAAITHAAVEACDTIDGVKDGYVMDPSKCNFTAYSILGRTITCTDLPSGFVNISLAAVKAAEAAWAGYHTAEGLWRYYGVSRSTNLTGPAGVVNTKCDSAGRCLAAPFSIGTNWVRNFLMKDLDADPMNLTIAQFDRLWQLSVQEWSSFMGSDDPDLSAFRNVGGKFLVWHGLDDTQIQPGGSEEYFNRVLAGDANATDYLRYFQAPGVGHCRNGYGAFPGRSLESLMDWVEKGIAPDTLYGRTWKGEERPICLYPKKVVYNGGKNTSAIHSFACA
ncbi:tannase and feruloyl esterase [Thozetella sp. PMI_491]|nr:tannase and feruloyl esterase [Thozetella sp. PMI_491]